MGNDPICIEIHYLHQNSSGKYNIEKNKTFEIVSDRNHTIQYDSENGIAYMRNHNGQYIKMEKQLLNGVKYYRYKSVIFSVTELCRREKRKYILTDVVTNKPRRERNSKSL